MSIMKLEMYLKIMSIKQKDFADNISEAVSLVNHYCLGIRIPRPAVMRKIYQVTKGLVQPNDFYNLDGGAANSADQDETEDKEC